MMRNTSYEEQTHLYGQIWTWIAVAVITCVPVAVCVYYHCWPGLTPVLKGLLGVAPIFWTVGTIEVITFTPMLGTAGSYLGFVTGNLTSLKVPAALGVFLLAQLTPILNSPVLKPAFDHILPALFGGLGVVYISKNWKIAIAPVCFMVLLFLLVPSLAGSVGVLVPVGALISIGVARVLYQKKLL